MMHVLKCKQELDEPGHYQALIDQTRGLLPCLNLVIQVPTLEEEMFGGEDYCIIVGEWNLSLTLYPPILAITNLGKYLSPISATFFSPFFANILNFYS